MLNSSGEKEVALRTIFFAYILKACIYMYVDKVSDK